MSLIMKKGMINRCGIQVEDDIYTCREAIKQQWFIKVCETGPIDIEAFMDSENPEEIFLLTSVGFIICQRVYRPNDPTANLDEYFAEMNRIKLIWKGKPKPHT